MNKLIFVNRYFYPDESATSQLLTDLGFRLADGGHNVHVITSRQLLEDPKASLEPKESVRGVAVHRIWTSTWGRFNLLGRAFDYLTFHIFSAFALLRLVGPGDIVVAKTDPPMIGFVAGLVASLRGGKLVNWMQDIYPEIADRLEVSGISGIGRGLRALRNSTCAKADQNVVIGRCMREFLLAEGIDEESLSVIPNWVNDRMIRPIPKENNTLASLWGLQDKLVIGYSGNIGRGHDFNALLLAAEAMADDPAVTFLFIGNGARRQDVEDRARALNLRNVVFQPYQPYALLPLSLTVPDIHVVTLQSEMSGLLVPSKFYGALAVGRPVVFIGPSDCEVARVINAHECGYVLEPDEIDRLGIVLRELCTNAEMRLAMGQRARQALDLEYSREHALVSWQGLLTEVADNAGAAGAVVSDAPNR